MPASARGRGMKQVEIYARVRHAVLIEGLSERAAAERFGINARTVSKMLRFSVPPGYVRTKPPLRPKLGAFVGIIDAILAADKERPKKQRHTAKRIFERLRDEHGFTGEVTIVKDYVSGCRQRSQEMFVPLLHPPGHAQVDFGEAIGEIGGVERKIHFLAMDLPHSDAIFVVGYPAETTEAFCDGHARAFEFFDGVPHTSTAPSTGAFIFGSSSVWQRRSSRSRRPEPGAITTCVASAAVRWPLSRFHQIELNQRGGAPGGGRSGTGMGGGGASVGSFRGASAPRPHDRRRAFCKLPGELTGAILERFEFRRVPRAESRSDR